MYFSDWPTARSSMSFSLSSIRNGLTLTLDDGTVEMFPEREAASTGRTYWGVSHELLIRDFYASLHEPGLVWGAAKAHVVLARRRAEGRR